MLHNLGTFIYQQLVKRTLLFSILLMIAFAVSQPELIIDGVTAATAVAPATPPTPKLKLTATPSLSANVIQAIEGQAVTITATASDTNGFTSLLAGIVQGNYIYSKIGSTGLTLPTGATLNTVNNNPAQIQFTWTPALGSAATTPSVKLIFGALNTYGNKSNTTQTITIVVNAATPVIPKLQVSASPSVVNNVINAIEGAPITINAAASDANGSTSLQAGIVQGGTFKNSFSLNDGETLALVNNNPAQVQYTWTPPIGSAAATPSITLVFEAINTLDNQSSTTQPITINIKTNDPTVVPVNTLPPTINLTASSIISNNVISVIEGQSITINATANDSTGDSTLQVGIIQGGVFKSTFALPDGETLSIVNNDPTQVKYSWTPSHGAAVTTPTITLAFEALTNTTSTTKTITIAVSADKTSANLPTSFDKASMLTPQTIKVDTPVKIPVIANPDPDKDKILIAATGLPKGAKLSKAIKSKNGQWVSQMTWTPNLAQLGSNTVTFEATDDRKKPALVTYPVEFIVDYVAAPSFVMPPQMPSEIAGIAKKPLTYKVIVNADPTSKNVLISATGLPKGAKLTKAKKVKNQWLSTLTWKPTVTQIGVFPVTISTQDPAAGGSMVSKEVTFTISAK